MNILFVNHENNLGGGTKSLLTLIDEINKHTDYNIYVFIPIFNEELNQGKFSEELKNRDVKVIRYKGYWWMDYAYKKTGIKTIIKQVINIITSMKLVFLCKKYSIDIIHSNSIVTNIGGIVSKVTNINHIWHLREFGFEDHNINFLFPQNKCFNFINNNSKNIICISKSVYQSYKKHLDNNKLKLIYNGISSDMLQTKDSSIKNGVVNLLISGTIKENKGQKQAILALSELIKRGCKNTYLNLAGTCTEEYQIYLNNLIKELRMENNVKFLGYVNDLKPIRKQMDIELVCSKKEAFGRVTVEGMMSENPIVGSDTGANKELIIDGYNGSIYKENNYVDLANKIEVFLKNPDKIREFGINGYKYAQENFTSEINMRNILQLYDEILKM